MSKKSVGFVGFSILVGILFFLLIVFGMKKLQVIGSTKSDLELVESQTIATEEMVITPTEETQVIPTETISVEEYYEMESQNDQNTENEIWESEYQGETSQIPSSEENDLTENNNAYQDNGIPYYIKVNRLANCVTIYGKDEEGNYTVPVKAMVCSVGLYGNTPLGVFTTSTKYAWRYLYGDVYGQYAYRIKGPILFHSVPYYEKDKGTLKSAEYNKLGEPASLGCIRLAVRDAKWLIDNCPAGTTVEIYESEDPGPLGKPTPIRIDLDSPNSGWDPTDPDSENPWLDSEPIISGANNKTVEAGSIWNPLEGVSAVDSTGNELGVTVEGNVDCNVPGTYTVTYSAVDSNGKSAKIQAIITVADTIKPELKISGSFQIHDGNKAQLMEMIYASTIAADQGKTLGKDKIIFEMSRLQNALSKGFYGIYSCSAVAVDEGGNQSNRVYFEVEYVYWDSKAPEITVEQSALTTQLECGTYQEEELIELAKTAAIKRVAEATVITDESTYQQILQVISIEKQYAEQKASGGEAGTESISGTEGTESTTSQGSTKIKILKRVLCNVKIYAEDSQKNKAELVVPVLVEIQ